MLVLVWSIIGVLISHLFFNGSPLAVLPFSLVALVAGLHLPENLEMWTREHRLSELRGDEPE